MKATTCPKPVEMISVLMAQGASLNARDDERRHVLLYACEHGASPSTINCVMDWSTRRKDCLCLNHVNSDREGPLILACRSGNVDLVLHMLQMCRDDFEDSRSNHPLRALHAAVQAGHEATVLALLRCKSFSEYVSDDFGFEGEDSDSSDWRDDRIVLSAVTLSDCIISALETSMVEAVKAFYILDPKITRAQCFRFAHTAEKKQNKTVEQEFKDIAREYVLECNWSDRRVLLPFMLQRSRDLAMATTPGIGKHLVAKLPVRCLWLIAQFISVFDPDERYADMMLDEKYAREGMYCGECEEWYLRSEGCPCWDYLYYDSD